MCGFVFYNGDDLDLKTIERSLESIGHRGPDDTQIKLSESAIFGFKRSS